MMRAHSSRAARSFATSMKKFMPIAKKNERRPANSSTSRPRASRGAHVLETVGEREAELLHRGRAGLLHVVAGDRDRVELRHVLRRVLDDVGDDPHARCGRIDVGVADHELFEDVVLDGPGELLLARRPAPRRRRRSPRAPAAPRRSSSSTPTSCRAGCRRRGSSCPRPSRSRRRPCRRRRRRAGGRCRSRGASRGRTRPTVPSARRRGSGGRRRSTPRRWRSRRTGGSSTAGSRTWWPAGPRTNGSMPGQPADGLERLEVGRGVERLDRDALGRLPRQRVGVGALQFLGGGRPPGFNVVRHATK